MDRSLRESLRDNFTKQVALHYTTVEPCRDFSPCPLTAVHKKTAYAVFVMAVREGFEPSNGLTRYTLSRRAPSATRTPHQNFKTFNLLIF